MTRDSTPFNETKVDLLPPEVVGVIPPFEGGEENLLPKDAWLRPLRIEFPLWSEPAPTSGRFDRVQLFFGRGADPVDERRLEGPIDERDLWLEVQPEHLEEGVYALYYRVLPWNGSTPRQCLPIHVTVDKSPPILANDSRLIFPSEVLPPNAITADYLEAPANQDQVLATVPVYRSPAPGDVVIATWKNVADGSSEQMRTAPLTHLNYMNPVTVIFTGDFIRSRGDGQRQVTYRVEDRAGNPSVESIPVDLMVAAIRPPRYLPHPWVVEIVDTPSDWGELDPEKTLRGATVRIPAEAVYYKDDRVEVQFGEPGATGSITVPVGADMRDVPIPKESIAAYFNQSLPVTYLIHLPDGSTQSSRPLTLAVRAFPPAKLLGAQLGAPHSDPAYKSNIPTTGLPVFQRTWPYISTQCLITITVTGTGADNQGKTQTILDPRPVTDTQTINGVTAAVPQGFMLSLKNEARFRVQTQVSFNSGKSWFAFTPLSPMLRP